MTAKWATRHAAHTDVILTSYSTTRLKHVGIMHVHGSKAHVRLSKGSCSILGLPCIRYCVTSSAHYSTSKSFRCRHYRVFYALHTVKTPGRDNIKPAASLHQVRPSCMLPPGERVPYGCSEGLSEHSVPCCASHGSRFCSLGAQRSLRPPPALRGTRILATAAATYRRVGPMFHCNGFRRICINSPYPEYWAKLSKSGAGHAV